MVNRTLLLQMSP